MQHMKKLLMAVALGAAAVSGCVSVESTRAQLNSNNPQEVKNAEETIYTIVTTGKDKTGFVKYQTQQQIEYVKLLSNQDILTKIFAETCYNDKIGIAVAKRMEFSKKDSIVSFLKKNKEALESSRIPESVMKEIINAMLSTSTVDGLAAAISYFNSDHSLVRLCYGEIEKPIARKLVGIATDQDLMFQFACSEEYDDSIKDIALAKLTDQKKLMSLYCNQDVDHDKVLTKLQEKTICDFIENDPRYREISDWGFGGDNGWAARKLVARIKDENLLANILIAKTSSSGLSYLINGIKDAKTIARIVVDAKNPEVRKMAAMAIKDYDVLRATLMNGKVSDEDLRLALVKNIEKGTADVKLYDGVENPVLKKAIFAKLSNDARIEINGRNRDECEKLIAKAKGKGSETFELAGFYLGMPLDDARMLVAHHFPELEITEGKNEDGEYKLDVSDQDIPFCWSDKERKVYQFNFGKQMLKKWFKYNAARTMDWAKAFSHERNIEMKLDFLERSDDVYLPNAMLQMEPHHVSLHQEIWTYKDGMKNYRVTYFGERKFGGNGPMIKSAAHDKYMYISAPEGTLRAKVEND